MCAENGLRGEEYDWILLFVVSRWLDYLEVIHLGMSKNGGPCWDPGVRDVMIGI